MLDVMNPATVEPVGSRSRRQVHTEGLWHQVFHCLVVRPTFGTVVLQRRAATKAAFPDKLDLSATGHLEAGETPLDGLRELEEELGLTPQPDQLVSLGHRLLADNQGEGNNREIVHLFLLADDQALDEYTVPADEVSGLVEVGSADFLRVLSDDTVSMPANSWTPGEAIAASELCAADLVAGGGSYWIVAAVMADRFLRGEEPIAI
ncbi:MAG: isopentenyldiphosphate isomerase [Acidimicrobiales bacterium]|jgi:isopentenyldiphosphate isomerase